MAAHSTNHYPLQQLPRDSVNDCGGPYDGRVGNHMFGDRAVEQKFPITGLETGHRYHKMKLASSGRIARACAATMRGV